MISKKHIFCLILGICFTFAKAQEQFSVFFESNKFECSKLESKKLQDWIVANKEVKIIAIHGFTDEDGNSGFNDSLAKKRVSFIYSKIKDQIKIREDFKTISYGKNLSNPQINQKIEKQLFFIYFQKIFPAKMKF